MFDEIPLTRPETPLLDTVENPADLRNLEESQLEQLCLELRHFLLYTVGQTGGHFGAGLGVIELTVALHYVFNTPDDRLVWDVGHQAYPHKILTERRQRMHTLRQKDGIAPFPSRGESIYDTFGVGHSSTSISAALGMAMASAMNGDDRKVVAIIGDGAMTAGLAFEALNHVTDTEANLLVILNDNAMSISRNAGGLAKYFARILASRLYLIWREGSRQILSRIPKAWELARRTEEHVKGMVVPGTLFDELGFNYMGPLDGHDVKTLVQVLSNIKDLKGPQFLHLVTQKGKGYRPAELAPEGSHNLSKIESSKGLRAAKRAPKKISYSGVFADWICDMAAKDPRLVGITPAMQGGSDLNKFAQQFPERYYDVAIAEQHAVTFAAGLACEGAKPVVAIYSTFLQRAYDQLIHDVSIQNLDVLLAIDRAGLLEDGPTHSGSFDLSYLRCIPNLLVMAPSDENECRQMLYTGYCHEGPAAVRYPRGSGQGTPVIEELTALPIGKGVVKRDGFQVAVLAFGSMLSPALAAAERLNATVVDMRFVKPLDESLIAQMAERHQMLVTIEENSVNGGAGSGVNEYLAKSAVTIPILNLGIPDHFVAHGSQEAMLADCGLNEEGIVAAICQRLESLGLRKAGIN